MCCTSRWISKYFGTSLNQPIRMKLAAQWLIVLTVMVLAFSFPKRFSSCGMVKWFNYGTQSRSALGVGRFPSFSFLHSTSFVRSTTMRTMAVDVVNPPIDYTEMVAKRKMAITLAYVGTNYYGLQMDPNTTALYPTIESKVEQTLYELGYIAESNKQALSKIQWSRSSRTDKGVHCARLVISAKLEMKLGWMKGKDFRCPELVELLNAKLPSDIRVVSICKINQGFRAKEACSWREYEYLLPQSLLFGGLTTINRNETKQRFMDCLRGMEGTQSFHNFHRLSPKALKGMKGKPTNKDNDETKEEEDSTIEDESDMAETSSKISSDTEANVITSSSAVTSSIISPSASSSSSSQSSSDVPNIMDDQWIPKPRERSEVTRGIIFACEIVENHETNTMSSESTSSDDDLIRIRIRGQSFLLHQIRLMISCAVLVARDIYPISALDMALLSPYLIKLPLAPAQGLVLINAGFDRNSNGQTVSIFESSSTPIESNDEIKGVGLDSTEVSKLVTEMQSSSAVSSLPLQDNANPTGQQEEEEDGTSTLYLMTPKEFDMSEIFKHDKIYTQVVTDWSGMDTRNGLPLISSWLTYIERYRVSSTTRQQWDELACSLRVEDEKETQSKREKEQHRLERNVASFREIFGQEKDMINQNNKSSGDSINKRTKQPIPHKKLLPNGISTAIINHFRVNPGESVLQCQRALATAIVNGEIDSSMQIEQLCQFMANNGGFEYFSSADVNRHPMID